MRLVVGLGNPGPDYSETRHNAGFKIIDHVARELGVNRYHREKEADVIKLRYQHQPLMLVKPQTMMNLSGRSVAGLAHYYRLQPEEVIVIHDDLDLELGRIRIRIRGSAGGHKGVASIIQWLGNESFIRVKVGIGRPVASDVVDYVLTPFNRQEQTLMAAAYECSARAVLALLEQDPEKVMNEFN